MALSLPKPTNSGRNRCGGLAVGAATDESIHLLGDNTMRWQELWPKIRSEAWRSGPQNSHQLDRKTLAQVICEYRSLYPRKTVYEAARWLHTVDAVPQRHVPTKYKLTVEYEETAEPSWCWTVTDNFGIVNEFGWAPTEERASKIGESVVAYYTERT